jgi:hypothetical protein
MNVRSWHFRTSLLQPTSASRQKRPLARCVKVILDWFIAMASRHRARHARPEFARCRRSSRTQERCESRGRIGKGRSRQASQARPRRLSATVANSWSQWVPSHRANVAWPGQRHLLGNSGRRKTRRCVAGSAPAAAMSCSELCQKDMPYRAGCGRIAVKARPGLLKRMIGESQGRRS